MENHFLLSLPCNINDDLLASSMNVASSSDTKFQYSRSTCILKASLSLISGRDFHRSFKWHSFSAGKLHFSRFSTWDSTLMYPLHQFTPQCLKKWKCCLLHKRTNFFCILCTHLRSLKLYCVFSALHVWDKRRGSINIAGEGSEKGKVDKHEYLTLGVNTIPSL